jgi:hypothetical protein
MTFGEVERVLGAPLPPSAYKYRPWWANEASGSHAQATAWLDSGFRAERVDMLARTLVFVGASADERALTKTYHRHPLLGSMKGMGRAGPGVDLTEPADPDWGRIAFGDE